MSIYEALRWLNSAGFTTRTGKKIGYSSLQIMLHNPFYYGVFEDAELTLCRIEVGSNFSTEVINICNSLNQEKC
jgi:hypothetical protein